MKEWRCRSFQTILIVTVCVFFVSLLVFTFSPFLLIVFFLFHHSFHTNRTLYCLAFVQKAASFGVYQKWLVIPLFFFVWELKKKSLADWLMYVYVDAEPILLWKPITKRKKRFGKKTTIATPSEINFSLIYCADCRNGKQQAFIQFFLLSPFFCVIIFFFFFDLNRKR